MRRKRTISVLILTIVIVASLTTFSVLEGITRMYLPEEHQPFIVKSTNFVVDPIFQKQYDIIDAGNITQRCKKYGFPYKNDPRNPQNERRMFFGAMVADESYDVIRMHATEIYGLYDVVVLVESERTHTDSPRTMRYTPGTPGHDLIHSGIFGPNSTTRVYLDVFTGNAFGAFGMAFEEIQREQILKRWKEAGMEENDVGVMADIDETMTRDFLLAGKQCDIPAFRPGQDCRRPRINAFALVFEGSPECVANDLWFHPDFMIGECIKYIGNPRGRPTPVRQFKGVHGERVFGWGGNHSSDYPADVIKNGSYPLANAADMRTGVENYALHGVKFVVAAYHFHNFFESTYELRHKYGTYGHFEFRVWKMTLSQIHADDVDMLVRCARDLPNSANPASKTRYEGGLDSYTGPKPIFFLNETYRRQRHAQVKLMIDEDEKQYGSKYSTGHPQPTSVRW